MKKQLVLHGALVALAVARVAVTLTAQCCVHTLRTLPELREIFPTLMTAQLFVWFLTGALVICLVVDLAHAVETLRELSRFLCSPNTP